MLAGAVAILLAHAAIGMLLAAAIARAPAGPGFYRLILLVGLGSLSLGLAIRIGGAASALPGLTLVSGTAYAVAFAAAVVFGAGLQRHERLAFGWLVLATLAGVVAVASDPALTAWSAGLDNPGALLYVAGLATVAPAVGSVLFAMLLAHWYLVEPKLPLGPLKKVLALFAATELANLLLVGAVVAHHWPEWIAMEGGLVRAFTLGNALFVFMRAFLGVLAPLGLAWMAWKTVEIRSIQSATGILYAAVVFVLFGETISLYLSLATGRPY